MADIIQFKTDVVGGGVRVDPDAVLESAKGIRSAVVIGTQSDGEMYFASSDGAFETLWLIEKAKAFLMSHDG